MTGAFIDVQLAGAADEIALVRLVRPEKRNAINDAFILELAQAVETLPAQVRAAVIHGAGAHFCAGLDLGDIQGRDAADGLFHSRAWHAAMEKIAHARVPVVAALHGAVIGGGMELASACHVRVADSTAFYACPKARAASSWAAGDRCGSRA